MECPVCFEVYRSPLLLPGCGHTICAACAELLVTEGNFLRCPECRLIYQLRRGVKSLPKNVALQRTIDEQMQSSSRVNLMCEEHPDDAVSLYCKTCEKAICLKCYFSGTLRKGDTMHKGHQVNTTEDAFTKEKRLLEERCKECIERQESDGAYIKELEGVEGKLKSVLEKKLASIDKNKNDIIGRVKQTASKLKFTLKGSVARDQEFLQMALESARERLDKMEVVVGEATDMLRKATDRPDVGTLKEAREKLDEIQNSGCAVVHGVPEADTFLKVAKFNTGLEACLRDPKMALSYQTEAPRAPTLTPDDCIISDTKAHITITCDEKVRIHSLTLFYKEAMYKGLSEKTWMSINAPEPPFKGQATVILKDLTPGTMYQMHAVASNDFGEGPQSNDLWFRTVEGQVEVKVT